jgi:hypothetical protein
MNAGGKLRLYEVEGIPTHDFIYVVIEWRFTSFQCRPSLGKIQASFEIFWKFFPSIFDLLLVEFWGCRTHRYLELTELSNMVNILALSFSTTTIKRKTRLRN